MSLEAETAMNDPLVQAVAKDYKIELTQHYFMAAVALFFNVDEYTVKRMIKRGQLQRIKIGKSVRVVGWVIAKALAYGLPEIEKWDGTERRTRQQPFGGVDRRRA